MSGPLEIVDPPRPVPLWLAYLRLFRLPNVFTAMADVSMGFLFQFNQQPERAFTRLDVFLCLLAASSCLYTSGMVLNDVYDLEVDRRERPSRPLPSGRISPVWAKWLGYELLLVGLALGWLAGIGMHGLTTAGFRSGGVATVLALCVVLYNAVLKKTLLGPLAMGSCRFLNVLLGMSVAPLVAGEAWPLAGFSLSELMVAAGIGTYIVGVTWFARSEAEESSGLQLGLGMAVMIGGLVLLGFFPQYLARDISLKLDRDMIWPLLLVLVTLTPLRRCGSAMLDPSPQRVQVAVKLCIMTLIVLDAAVTMAMVGQMYAVGVLALLLPAFVLGKWVYST